MFSLLRNDLFYKTLVKNLFKNKTKCLKTSELSTNQLLMGYIHSSAQVFGTKGIEITMPSLSPTMTSGTIVKWVKKEGDPIGAGDLICEVQTDKAIVGLELEEEGILAKILVPNDSQDIKIGSLIALMVEEGQDWKDVDIPQELSTQTTDSKVDERRSEKSDELSHSVIHLMGPSVRNLLNQFGIHSNSVQSSGPHKTLLKSDVLKYIKDNQLKPKDMTSATSDRSPKKSSAPKTVVKSAEYIDIELSNMRKTIAKRLTQSKTTIPHSYMTADCPMNGIINARKQLKQMGTNVSVNDFIIKGTAVALKKVPQINSVWNESTSSIQLLPTVDISIAVATPNGLITPIVKNANDLDLETISQTVKALAEKAREGKLQPNEFMGGSFSISNLGMYGTTQFSAVINPPQSAILAIGSSRLVLDGNNQTQHLMTVTLSFDARVIEEETAAKFLEELKVVFEDPFALQNSDVTDNRRLNAFIA